VAIEHFSRAERLNPFDPLNGVATPGSPTVISSPVAMITHCPLWKIACGACLLTFAQHLSLSRRVARLVEPRIERKGQ
jgi:hypothetical protein